MICENFPYNYEFLEIFEEISKIPHGSGNTAAIAQYCVDFAINCGCDVMQDSMGNVVIKRPAGIGFESAEPVILQGHLDMVCDKAPGSNHDFLRDPLKLTFDGKYITAEDTTLGGDDGIAIAYGLALVKDKQLQLPPLEILLTVDEETGLFGAAGLDGSLLSGKKLINLDSEEEGVLLCGCAGGVTAYTSAELETEEATGTLVTVTVSGLAGGHSGVEIHKQRLNAVKVMTNLLNSVECGYRLVSLVSGTKINAIPCNCVAKVLIAADDLKAFKNGIESAESIIEIISSDDKLKVSVETETAIVNALSYADTKRVFGYFNDVADGVLKQGTTGVVTSLNTGISDFSGGKFCSVALVRSMDNADLSKVAEEVCNTASKYGFEFKTSDYYPAWEYNHVSPLREKIVSVYEKLYGKKATVATIHAGLECGLISDKIPGMDAVSFGPNILDVHTVNESLDVESSIRTWEFLVELLKSF